MQMVGETAVGVTEQFQGVDRITVGDDGSIEVLERVEGAVLIRSQWWTVRLQLFGWATGELPEPPNNPQIGMQNMQKNMPALHAGQACGPVRFQLVLCLGARSPRQQRRETRVEKDMSVDDMAKDIVEWIKG